MLMVMTLALAGIVVRLVDLQVVGHDRYATEARRQLMHEQPLTAVRGSIFDRNGQDLALSVPRATIIADPVLVTDRASAARTLSPLLGVPVSTLETAMEQRRNDQGHRVRFSYLKRRVAPQLARQIAALHVPGVGQVAEPKRVHPAGTVAAPILGFVGSDNLGVDGLESKYGRFLAGTAGSLQSEQDPNGREIPATERREIPAKRGGDLVLTIDQSLQYMAERALTQEVETANAAAGMAAIVDVQTGNVVSMVNVDGRVGGVAAHPATPDERNRLLTDVYEPGSTTKVLTVAGALESGAITVDTPFSVPSSIQVGGKDFPDDEYHGRSNWTVREILAKSSNVGAIEIAQKIGREKLDRTMREFGFGARTAIQFPGESAGLLHGPFTVDPSIMGSMPIGYGISTTAMQTLAVFSTVAAGGVSHPARLIDATIDADGNRHRYPTPAPHRVISAATAATLNDLLRGVVSDGTGVKAAIPGYTSAGKTGTSRKAPYTVPYKYMASFAGFAPAEAPRFAAVVVLDDPKANGLNHGGAVAAPVFSKIMQYALQLFHVPPTASVGADAGRPTQVDRSGTGTVSTPVP